VGFDPGPSLRAAPFDAIGDGAIVRLLTTRQRRDLLALSTRITIGPRGTLYREHAAASAVYICSAGALRAFRDFPSGRRRVTAFLFPDDLFGLSEHGRYLNTCRLSRPRCVTAFHSIG
jgi:CRP-like cAMP-binding protein